MTGHRRRRDDPRTRPWRSGLAGAATVFVVTVFAAAACTTGGARPAVPGDPVVTQPVDPSFVQGTDHGPADTLAATVVSDAQDFWHQMYPATFGAPWQPLRGAYSVDTDSRSAAPAPCTGRPAELEGNALYCPSADAVAWDRAALLPVLQDHFGSAGVAVVLAHEMGHAVQNRAGITPARERAEPQTFPTVLIESMADCYSGAFLRWVADGHAPHLRITRPQLDTALGAIVTFRDPVGTGQPDALTHGDALDRVSAFEDGYQGGAALCAGMTVRNAHVTGQDAPNRGDQATAGNRALPTLLADEGPDLAGVVGAVVNRAGSGRRTPWQPPTITTGAPPPRCGGGDQGPITWCPNDNTIAVDATSTLPRLHRDIGVYATGTLLAARFGLAALGALGKPVRGPDAGRGAVCLAGAYTAVALARPSGVTLSPGDLDEAVQLLLSYDYPSRGLDGAAVGSAFDRLAAFRTGVEQGSPGCGIG